MNVNRRPSQVRTAAAPTVTTQTRLSPEVYNAVRRLAIARNASIAATIDGLLAEGLGLKVRTPVAQVKKALEQ